MKSNKKTRGPKDTRVHSQNDSTTILHECQMDAFMQCAPQRRKEAILRVLADNKMTARQIAYFLNYSDLNAVKPRLSEMVRSGEVEVIGKAFDTVTKRKVAVYRRIK